MNIVSVGAAGLYTALSADEDIVALVEDRIYFEDVDTAAVFPYIKISHMFGGEDNKSPARGFDMIYQVEGISNQKPEAEALADAIQDTLVGQNLAFPDQWRAWAKVTQTQVISNTINLQNTQFSNCGGWYRLRATKRP